jgi:hypothetical protein
MRLCLRVFVRSVSVFVLGIEGMAIYIETVRLIGGRRRSMATERKKTIHDVG